MGGNGQSDEEKELRQEVEDAVIDGDTDYNEDDED